MSETDILREALTKLLRGAGVAKLGLARDGVQHAKLVQMEGIATTALAAPRDTGTEAVLEDAIAFIESLAVVPLLMSDDIKMRLQDVQAHARVEAASLRKRLTDRATRPAEPASPVAEAGDGEASRYIAKCREMSKGENGHTYTWWSRLADFLSTLEAERARADAAEQRAADALASIKELEFGAGFEAAFDAVVRPGSRYENWRPADDPAEIVTDLYNDLEDALARAEKAAEDERDRLYAEAKGMEGVDSSIAAGWLRYLGPAMLPADRANLRASREAQPATDGGEA